MENAIIYLTQQLLAHTKISCDKEELAFQIQSHPSFPSMHSITGVLDHFNIDNLALDVPNTVDILRQLPKAFLAQLKTDEGNDFALILNNGANITVINSPKEKQTLSVSNFLEMFTGIIVAIEKDPQQAETPLKATNYRKGLFALLGVVLIGLILMMQPGIVATGYFLLSLAGLITSIAIVKQNFGMQSSLGNAFCSDTDTSKNCNAVLTSKGSKIFGLVKLSDLSIVYFVGMAFSIIASSFQTSGLLYLYTLSLLAIPVIVYSIYYQYAFAKAWCPLCLVIATLLTAQSIIAAFYISDSISATLSGFHAVLIASVFLTSYLIWKPLATLIEQLKTLKQTKIDYFKFKRQFEMFKSQLALSPQKNTTILNTGEIIFGNKEAALSIVVVTSPFCGHCKPVHTTIEEMLSKYGNQIAVTVRFSVNPKHIDGDLYKITSRLTELYHTEGSEICLKAMHEIYASGDTEQWLEKWESCKKTALYGEVLKKQYEWCVANNINFTPEILIDGRSFPKTYKRTELPFFIEDLAEELNTLQNVGIHQPI